MADVKKCDRCGDIYNTYELLIDALNIHGIDGNVLCYKYTSWGDDFPHNVISEKSSHIDLCPKCLSEFMLWLFPKINKNDLKFEEYKPIERRNTN